MNTYRWLRSVLLVGLMLVLSACSVPESVGVPVDLLQTTGNAVGVADATPEISGELDEGDTSTVPTHSVPLAEEVDSLQPQDVFSNFYEITQIPRPSGHTEAIRAFVVAFGEGLELETIVDEAGNVIIRKPASPGLEHREGVILQAHMDMVPQKTDDKQFDFEADPIPALVQNDYIIADGTTLGADDGIGMAMIMAVLQSDTLELGPIEGLFTVDEETDMSGINGLAPGVLQGTTLINLDSEEEGTFTIGSAGGGHAAVHAGYEQTPVPDGMVGYVVEVNGLQGGHSGVDINLGRGHATKLLVRLLNEATEPFSLRLSSIASGTAGNAIPREATALVWLDKAQTDEFLRFSEEFEATVRSELQAVEPDLRIEVSEAETPADVMEAGFQETLIDALYATPQGVLRMSDAVPGLVETSTNMGITNVQDGHLEMISYPRSSVDSAFTNTTQMIGSVWELAGLDVEVTDVYSGWAPDPNSPILALMQGVYEDLYGHEPVVSAVHAGLECGVLTGTYPDMDMISIGPTIENVHSPSEQLYIPSVARTMDLLTTTLELMP